MALYAEAGCILRVDIQCDRCRYTIMEVISSITGVYNVDIDGTRGIVKVYGEVDPNVLLRAVQSTGRHAEVLRMNFRHPSWSHTNSYYPGPLGYSHFPTMSHYPLDYCHHCPIGGSTCMTDDYPFRRTTGHGYGLASRRRAPFGAFSHGLSHTGGMFGGGGSYHYSGNYGSWSHY